jgi:FMN phosphatase YigB (HAD superfamily)
MEGGIMDIPLVLDFLVPSAIYGGFPSDEESYNKLRWQDERDKPTWEEIQGCWEQHEIKMTYKVKRMGEYPPMSEQLDMIYHNGLDAWKETIRIIKEKYPKQ